MSRRTTLIERRIRQSLRKNSNQDSQQLAVKLVAKNAGKERHIQFVQTAKGLGVK